MRVDWCMSVQDLGKLTENFLVNTSESSHASVLRLALNKLKQKRFTEEQIFAALHATIHIVFSLNRKSPLQIQLKLIKIYH